MMKSSGCVVPWIQSNETICTDKGTFKCIITLDMFPDSNLCLTAAINNTYWIAWNRVTNSYNDCHKPCRSLNVMVGGRNMKKVSLN